MPRRKTLPPSPSESPPSRLLPQSLRLPRSPPLHIARVLAYIHAHLDEPLRLDASREYIPVVAPLFNEWLPKSGEQLRDFPLFFHYVNVGPGVAEQDMITDIYLPLR